MSGQKKFLKIVVDKNIYPLEAIYGASYVFVDRCYIFLDSLTKRKISIVFRPKNKNSFKQLEKISQEFFNELLNYSLRIYLTKQNKKIKERVIEQALFSAIGGKEKVEEENCGCEDNDLFYNYKDDPLGIAIPWEEKYLKGDSKES